MYRTTPSPPPPTSGGNADPHRADPQFVGETITVSYTADPRVGHGQFRLENQSGTDALAAVEEAWVELGAERRPLSGVSVFVRELGHTVDARGFTVRARTTVTLLVGFPAIIHEPRFGESVAVGLRLRLDGRELQAVAPIQFERRIPR